MNPNQIAAEAADEWLKPAGLKDPLLSKMRNELATIIQAAIERATEEWELKWFAAHEGAAHASERRPIVKFHGDQNLSKEG